MVIWPISFYCSSFPMRYHMSDQLSSYGTCSVFKHLLWIWSIPLISWTFQTEISIDSQSCLILFNLVWHSHDKITSCIWPPIPTKHFKCTNKCIWACQPSSMQEAILLTHTTDMNSIKILMTLERRGYFRNYIYK
jgi:hypothetical protein